MAHSLTIPCYCYWAPLSPSAGRRTLRN